MMFAIAHFVWGEKVFNPNDPNGNALNSIPAQFWVIGSLLVILIAAALLFPAAECLHPLVGHTSNNPMLSQPFLDSEPRSASAGPMRPKLLYANERTFIHWSHTCTLLASSAMAIVSNPKVGARLGGSALAGMVGGVILSLIAVALLAYAHRTYFWRARAILSHSNARCDDARGPVILASALLLAIVASLAALLLPQA
jgi:uncharacterized membrane protein YidH (DUF202 family)